MALDPRGRRARPGGWTSGYPSCVAQGLSIGEWARLAAACASVAGGGMVVRRRDRRRLPAGALAGTSSAGAAVDAQARPLVVIGAVALGAGLVLGGIVSGDPPFLTVVWWTLAAVAVQVPLTMAGLSLPRAPALWREARADGSTRPAAVALTLAGAGLLAVPA